MVENSNHYTKLAQDQRELRFYDYSQQKVECAHKLHSMHLMQAVMSAYQSMVFVGIFIHKENSTSVYKITSLLCLPLSPINLK